MLDMRGIIRVTRLTQARHIDAARNLLYHNSARSIGLCESSQPHSAIDRAFYVSSEGYMARNLTPEQRERDHEYRRRWRERNRESIRAYHRKWREDHPDKSGQYSKKLYYKNQVHESERKKKYRRENPEHLRNLSMKRRYGITADDYAAMVVSQDGKCAICGKEDNKLHIDHNHETGHVRGLLCGPCNRKLHSVETESFLTKALAYLNEYE